MKKSTWRSIFEYSITLLVLAILILYTYARFFEVPYIGFDYQTSSGRIIEISREASEGSLRLGDVLVQVGSLSWEEYRTTLHRVLFEKGQEEIPLLVQRGDEQVEILWKVPETDIRDVQGRFMMLWIPYITQVAT